MEISDFLIIGLVLNALFVRAKSKPETDLPTDPVDAIERQLEKLHDVAQTYKDDYEDVPEYVSREIGRLNEALVHLTKEKVVNVLSKETKDELRPATGSSGTASPDAFNYKR